MSATIDPPAEAAPTTQQQASGSSFYAAMRLLPPAERAAMFAIYGFCRVVDDVADEPGPSTEQRRKELNEYRADVAALFAHNAPERLDYLVAPLERFGLKQDDFLQIVDGMEMDVDGPIIAPTFATLDLYCDRVASAVGRLSTRIFGMDDEPGAKLAHHLGRALQLTNILRDIDEDAEMGRLYLPVESLEIAGIETREPVEVIADPAIDIACRWVAKKAHEHYDAADLVLKSKPTGRIRSPRLMREVYAGILRGMEKVGWHAPRHRISLPRTQLLWIVLRHGLVD
ncbi:MAG TPA: presqualene diphosphate synthase HpnD [Caulobacteraceae bacterium]|jgi:phytoene synthase